MFKSNVGTTDRIIRIVAGLVMLSIYFFTNGNGPWHALWLIGFVPFLTGAFGTCPLYSIFGLSTCPTK
ncbi:MAG: DUF2892 domain-containing protein [Limimaricola sp.]|uniref:YgaP family membrane protein n=1 Tax=Limimaricola sp. TaxID=2211665 RepID=UPI001E0AD007|nr:DUF2892 domain-containing protein [Limimaricola sp.]MBI1418391.1 DUF2892 domain-containing protein [Limimaricola sp.]